jgi:hypothetical protein
VVPLKPKCEKMKNGQQSSGRVVELLNPPGPTGRSSAAATGRNKPSSGVMDPHTTIEELACPSASAETGRMTT